MGFLNHAYPIVYHHHERFDGQGYPDGLQRENIPLGARIVSIADAFDAMTTQRPYRMAMSQAQAIRELRRGAGHQWDPELVDAFLDAIHIDLPARNGHRHREEPRRSRRTAQAPGTPR